MTHNQLAEEKLLQDKAFQHILKFAPESQRELMTFELARYFAVLIEEAERLAYGRGTVDTLDHVKAWADKTETTYNEMMSARLKALERST